MKKLACSIAVLLFAFALGAQTFTWESCRMDGHRTGAKAISDNVESAIGTVKSGTYFSPSGKVFKGGTIPEVVRIVSDAQIRMSSVKKVIGHSSEYMERIKPECPLYDMAADWLMESAAEISGKKVDLSIINVGGIRVDLPKGDIILDDIQSMFPFKNHVALVTLTGRRVREILDQMVSRSGIQALGGVRIVVREGQLVSAEVAGEPLDDERTYNLATIDFLLHGGDHFSLADDALEVVQYDEIIGELMVKKVEKLTAEGKMVEYRMDNRIIRDSSL